MGITSLDVRCTPDELRAWRESAEALTLPFEAWCRFVLLKTLEEKVAVAPSESEGFSVRIKVRMAPELKHGIQEAAGGDVSAWVRGALTRYSTGKENVATSPSEKSQR